jgi:capsular polysaccharide biosynthesis protein
VEEQYKVLTRDYDTAQKNYQDLLAKRDASETTQDVEKSQLGEQFQLIGPADLPDAPSFPKRWLFAIGGLAAGLSLGFGLAFLFELKDDSIRTEPDVEAVLELPTLIALPWVGVTEQKDNGDGNSAFWRKSKDAEKETVGV